MVILTTTHSHGLPRRSPVLGGDMGRGKDQRDHDEGEEQQAVLHFFPFGLQSSARVVLEENTTGVPRLRGGSLGVPIEELAGGLRHVARVDHPHADGVVAAPQQAGRAWGRGSNHAAPGLTIPIGPRGIQGGILGAEQGEYRHPGSRGEVKRPGVATDDEARRRE